VQGWRLTAAPPRGSELAAEQAAGQPVYRATFGTARPGGPLRNALDIELKNPANTNVLLWGDVPHTRLLALWEARARARMQCCSERTQDEELACSGRLAD